MLGFIDVSGINAPAATAAGLAPGSAGTRELRRTVALLRRILMAGIASVLLLPAARGYGDWLGWLPLWLVGMPLSALWAAHALHMLRRAPVAASGTARRRRHRPQARRRTAAVALRRLPRAA